MTNVLWVLWLWYFVPLLCLWLGANAVSNKEGLFTISTGESVVDFRINTYQSMRDKTMYKSMRRHRINLNSGFLELRLENGLADILAVSKPDDKCPLVMGFGDPCEAPQWVSALDKEYDWQESKIGEDGLRPYSAENQLRPSFRVAIYNCIPKQTKLNVKCDPSRADMSFDLKLHEQEKIEVAINITRVVLVNMPILPITFKKEAVESDSTTSPPCSNIVIDGYFNSLFIPVDKRMTIYKEVVLDTISWGSRVLRQMKDGRIGVFACKWGGYPEMIFSKLASTLPRSCMQHNWASVYKYGGPNEYAMLSGTPAVTNCIPFPGTIDGGPKVAVISAHSIGDCAEAVAMKYSDATGVQVDPWSTSIGWNTTCYAVFGKMKKDEPNNRSAHRACFFHENVLPGGLLGGTSLGNQFADIQSCIKSVKGNADEQKVEAIGVTFDRESHECWYHKDLETSVYEHNTQVHVLFARPLSRQHPR